MIAISIDGNLVPAAQAAVSVLDRGFLYGDGLFEVLRTWGGIAVDLDAHLDRLFASASALQLQVMERVALADSVDRTLAAAQPVASTNEHRVRIVVTRGPGPAGGRFADLPQGHSIVIVEPLLPQPTELTAAVVDWPLPHRRAAGHKTLAYLDHLVARELAAVAGADEALRLDDAGFVVEGATSNVFVVDSGRVITPSADTGILPGITRHRVLQCCARLGIPAVAEPLRLDQLRNADEIFITSALRGIVAITRLDGQARPPGPVTAQLADAYLNMMRRQPPSDP